MTFLGRFAGKVAVVTGAAQGIGRDVALRLAAEGSRTQVPSRVSQSPPKILSFARRPAATIRVKGMRCPSTWRLSPNWPSGSAPEALK